MHNSRRIELRLSTLKIVSVCYLALPLFLFFNGWLRWYMAVPACCMLLLGIVVYGLKARQDSLCIELSTLDVTLAVVLSLGIISISGIGGMGFADSDWIKHNAILRTLIDRPMPTFLSVEGSDVPLSYYVAYYLPAAAIGRFAGWFWTNQFLALWSFAGLLLSIFWFMVLIGRSHWAAILFFFLFSGLDGLGCVGVSFLPDFSGCTIRHIEWWSHAWQYSAHVTALFWAPQHALSGWIGTGMLIHSIQNAKSSKFGLLIWSLIPLWSPFVALGLMPFLVVGFLLKNGSISSRLRAYVSIPNACACVILIIQGLYFLSKFSYGGPLLPQGEVEQGFIFGVLNDRSTILVLGGIFFFLCIEVLPYAGVALLGGTVDSTAKRFLFIAAVATLLIIPFYKFGMFNDFCMRTAVPSLFFLAALSGTVLLGQKGKSWVRWALIAIILVGSYNVYIEMNRHLREMLNSGRIYDVKPFDKVRDMIQANDYYSKDREPQDWWLPQYLGDPEAAFFKYLSKPRKP